MRDVVFPAHGMEVAVGAENVLAMKTAEAVEAVDAAEVNEVVEAVKTKEMVGAEVGLP